MALAPQQRGPQFMALVGASPPGSIIQLPKAASLSPPMATGPNLWSLYTVGTATTEADEAAAKASAKAAARAASLSVNPRAAKASRVGKANSVAPRTGLRASFMLAGAQTRQRGIPCTGVLDRVPLHLAKIIAAPATVVPAAKSAAELSAIERQAELYASARRERELAEQAAARDEVDRTWLSDALARSDA